MKIYDETLQQYIEVSIKALDSMAIGSIIAFAGDTIPTGWLVCDGTTLNEEEYPELYDVIGYKYGGSGLDFNLPNFKGRVPVGLDTTQTEFDNLGETGGSKTHNHDKGSYYATMRVKGNEIQFKDTAHNWTSNFQVSGSNSQVVSINQEYAIGVEGTSGTSNNMPPYIVVNYIIKATNTTPTMASVVNATNNSTTDTYSCDYSNKHYGGVVLYSDDNGTTGNITLDDSSVNYSYIDIQFKGNNGSYDITRVYSPNGKAVNLFSANSDGTYIWQQVQVVNIVGTNITRASAYEWRLNSPSTINVYPTNVYITKVVGYK